MDLHYILIVDVNSNSCPAGDCGRLQSLLRKSLPSGEIHLQTTTTFSPELTLSSPALILLRPSLTKMCSGLLDSLRTKWSQASILGLFCADWEGRGDAFQFLIGALDDFVFCPFREMDLIPRIQRFLRWKNGAVASSRARAIKEKFHLESLVGEGESFLRVIEKIPPVAHSDATVLISGATGTGKELFARAIHYVSPRQGKPFVPVNCGALPDHLFENELFGHVRGAFTDAASAEKGLLAVAEGGTLFLDEVDTLSPSAQVKLLRFLQDREYRPLGSSKCMIADVRIIAATGADLRQRVEIKLLREDLYHRLNVLSLSLPPLRERIEDIPLLAYHFLAKHGNPCGREFLHLTRGALQKLMSYSWPGNIRELEGVIQRAVVLTSSTTFHACDIDLPLPYEAGLDETCGLREAKSRVVGQFERAYLINLLAANHGNVSQAAKVAGKERRDFQRLLRKHHLRRQTFQN